MARTSRTSRPASAAADVAADKARLSELAEQSDEYAQALRLVVADLDRGVPYETAIARIPASRRPSRPGRPTRVEAHAHLAEQAPIPELVTIPADKAGRWMREHVSDPELLRAQHRFEVEHGRRRSVLRELATRLRALGEPLGGPDPAPWDGYDASEPALIVRELRRRRSKSLAARVYAWEHYRRARPEILEAAQALAGADAARALVEQTAPAALVELPEPWPGYDLLTASPQGRAAVADAFDRVSADELREAREYERQVKNRKIMLAAIDAEIARRPG